MQTVTLTAQQTRIYDGDDESATRELMREILQAAQRAANLRHTPCEVYTDDGIVIVICEPE